MDSLVLYSPRGGHHVLPDQSWVVSLILNGRPVVKVVSFVPIVILSSTAKVARRLA